MQDQEGSPVRGRRMRQWRERSLPCRIRSEGLPVGASQPRPGLLELRGDVVPSTVQQHDPREVAHSKPDLFQVSTVGTHQRRQVRPGAVAHEHNTLPVETKRGGTVDQILQRHGDILRLRLNVHRWDQAIVQRGERITGRPVVGHLLRALRPPLVAVLPATAMDKDDERRAPGQPTRPPEVQRLQGLRTVGQCLRRTRPPAVLRSHEPCAASGHHHHHEAQHHRRPGYPRTRRATTLPDAAEKAGRIFD